MPSEGTVRHTRRPHSKSRRGCGECRRRRVKCGEEKPQCRQCVRREVPCVYPLSAQASIPTSSLAHPVHTQATTSSGSGTHNGSHPSSPFHRPTPSSSEEQSTLFTVRELSLFHHWIVHTSKSIVHAHPNLLSLWQTAFPQAGFEHPFVLHGMLSLVLLHQAHLSNADRKYLVSDAAHYHNLAIQGFQQQTVDITDRNCDALFVCATLNIIYVFGMYGWLHEEDESPTTRASRILGAEWIPIVRGVAAVLQDTHERVRHGPLAPLLDVEPFDQFDLDHDRCAEDDRLCGLRRIWDSSREETIYEEALSVLRKCYIYMERYWDSGTQASGRYYDSALSGPVIWLILAPSEYFDLLAQRQPPALVLFAHLGVLFTRLDLLWYFQGWGQAIVQTIAGLLGEYWRPHLIWALEQAQPPLQS